MLKKTWSVVVTALLVLVGAEAGVRTFADDLPRALEWGNIEAELKADRMTQLQRFGVRASVAFVGSSMMDVGVDPEKMDLGSKPDEVAFNAALFATDARTMAFYTEHVVVPRLRPRVVVIGVSSFDLNDGGDTQRISYENIVNSPEAKRVTGRRSTIEEIDAFATTHSAIMRHRTTLRSPAELAKDDVVQDASVNPYGVMSAFQGPRPKYQVTGFFKNLARNETYKAFSVGGSQLRALDRVIGSLRADGIGVVVVKMPLTMDAVDLHPNGVEDYERFKTAVKQVVDRHGVQYVDVPTARDGSGGFYDPVHLNNAGQKYFSDALGRIVRDVVARSRNSAPQVPSVDQPDVDSGVVSAADVDAPDAQAPDADAPAAEAPDTETPDAPAAPPPPTIVIPAPEPDAITQRGAL
jgi:hypothetical protein